MLKIILWHVGYIAVVVMFFMLHELIPGHVDDYRKLPAFVRFLIKLIPLVFIAFFFGFCLMHALLCTDTTEAFWRRFLFMGIEATYVSLMIIRWNYNDIIGSKLLTWLPPLAHFIYSIIKNIMITDGIFQFILWEAISLVILGVGYFATEDFSDLFKPTDYDKEQIRKMLEEDVARREAEEAEAARRRAESLYKPFEDTNRRRRGGNESKRSFSDLVMEDYENSRTMRNVRGEGASRTCANCRYYDGRGCDNPASRAYQTTIWYASDHNCGQHSY